jgi:thiosulfate/3-mercaptopyruvate sulfurtransferase
MTMPNSYAIDSGSHPLVSCDWLARNLGHPKLRILDVRWRSRYENGRGISFDDHDGYRAGHIPGAVFARMVEDLSDPNHGVSDMLAPPEQFARAMGRLGVESDTLVIAYDNMGFPLGSARLWWALNYYSHERVRVLDGGLRQWSLEQRPLSTEVPTVEPTVFTARPQPGWLANKQDVVAALDRDDTVIIDCLTPELYRGSGNRHVWGQRPGHVPGAANVPYPANIDPKLATATSAERESLMASGRPFVFGATRELSTLYHAAGVRPESRVITYCGRGYAAACGLLALKILGHDSVQLYDGSWTEWSADPSLPTEVSA